MPAKVFYTAPIYAGYMHMLMGFERDLLWTGLEIASFIDRLSHQLLTGFEIVSFADAVGGCGGDTDVHSGSSSNIGPLP